LPQRLCSITQRQAKLIEWCHNRTNPGLECGLSGREPALQEWSPEFKLQTHQKKKIKDILLIPNSQTPQSFQDENMDPRGTRGLLDYHKDIILGANLLKGDYKRG
jgi:hypothetical protein